MNEAECNATILEFCDFIKRFLDSARGGNGMNSKDDSYNAIIHTFYFLHKLFFYIQ